MTVVERTLRFDQPSRRSRHGSSKSDATNEHVSELLCALATERRENESLRKYMEWLVHRVQTLELQLQQGAKRKR